MIQSFSTARLGLSSQQKRVDTIAHNLANLNTYGYKASSVRFKDALYTTMQRPVQPQAGVDLQLGTGVLVSSIARSYIQGTPLDTGDSLDLCLSGDGFFTVQNGGQVQYTRDGCFAISNENDGQYLVTAQGYYVLDNQMQRIRIPEGGELSVSAQGALSIGEGAPFATLNIAAFANNDGLESVGGNCFAETVASGQPAASQAEVRQGFLEGSNVDLAQEMTRLIRAQRCYSLAGRAVTALDDMQAVANNLR